LTYKLSPVSDSFSWLICSASRACTYACAWACSLLTAGRRRSAIPLPDVWTLPGVWGQERFCCQAFGMGPSSTGPAGRGWFPDSTLPRAAAMENGPAGASPEVSFSSASFSSAI